MSKTPIPKSQLICDCFAPLRDELTMPESISAVLLKSKTKSQIPSADLRR